MAWIEFHQPLVTHRKLYALAAALKVRRAVAAGHLAFLWCWALDNAPDGDLTGIDPEVIRMAADWPKNAAMLISALTSAGFIDEEHDTRTLHDWGDYAGKLLDRRERNREAMRRARVQHVQTRVKLPNPTVDNPTEPNRSTGSAREDISRAMRAVENLTGSLTKTVSDDVLLVLDDGVSGEWIEAACQESERQNKRSWAYCAAILARWKIDGFKADRRTNGTRQVRGTATDEDPAASAIEFVNRNRAAVGLGERDEEGAAAEHVG